MGRTLHIVLALLALPASVAAQADLDPTSRAAALDAEIARALATIEQAEARKARVDAEIEGLAERRDAAGRRLRTRTRALYRLTRSGMLPVAGGFDAMLGHLGRLERLERMVKGDVESLDALRARGQALRAETGELTRAIERARAELRALSGRKQALERDRQSSAMFQQAFTQGAPRVPEPREPSYGTLRVVDEDDEGLAFAALRGRLPMPVGGAVDIRQAQRDGGPGLDFLAPPGTQVRAVAEGTVAFADRHGSYGQLVIVDHGGSYFTVYGGLGACDVRVGDVVSRGARIGDVGNDHRPTSLFFEVRHGTRTLDAVSWVGL